MVSESSSSSSAWFFIRFTLFRSFFTTIVISDGCDEENHSKIHNRNMCLSHLRNPFITCGLVVLVSASLSIHHTVINLFLSRFHWVFNNCMLKIGHSYVARMHVWGEKGLLVYRTTWFSISLLQFTMYTFINTYTTIYSFKVLDPILPWRKAHPLLGAHWAI